MISPSVSHRPTSTEAPDIRESVSGGLVCVALEGEAEFLALEPTWRELTDRATDRTPSLSWPWLCSWWEVFGAICPKTHRPGTPYVVLVFDGSTPVAAYPFVSHRVPWWSFVARRLRPMGHSGELEPSGLTEEPLCAVATGYEERARAVVVDHIARRIARRDWDCAVVRQLNHDETPVRLRAPFGAAMATKVKNGPQIVRLPETWTAFRQQLTKSMRDNLPYYPRLLTRSGHQFAVRICQDSASIAAAGQSLIQLHRDRVFSDVGQKHQDYFSNEWQPTMLALGFQRLADENRGFIAVLEIDGTIAAAQSFIQTDRELLVHYSGFDPRFAKFSPLLVLQTEVFREAIERRSIRKLNLLFGSAPWQKRWSANSEGNEVRVHIVSVSPLPLLRVGLYAIAREAAAFCRRSGVRRWRDRFAYQRPSAKSPHELL
jgi:CelD/BcsL family acetyltransferase involved in cellulose biosynthesis